MRMPAYRGISHPRNGPVGRIPAMSTVACLGRWARSCSNAKAGPSPPLAPSAQDQDWLTSRAISRTVARLSSPTFGPGNRCHTRGSHKSQPMPRVRRAHVQTPRPGVIRPTRQPTSGLRTNEPAHGSGSDAGVQTACARASLYSSQLPGTTPVGGVTHTRWLEMPDVRILLAPEPRKDGGGSRPLSSTAGL